ncbi:cellobiose transport system substrate-binding protein [Allocatelliglobosispora scoriae]|uniref:Cellobiose transport system substrate-binding protein n=1 Tax=Allocatelliglobosispora scoriae TaxID=643052 RepID=A0A841BXG9_9ACTN|nr:extracellular solute-binding protein [Allocatelliglobosispora scoriae]MBB5871410.1 cellobiose transport system substrate-binding protein [Allocatelliglobosispora scoriae]
MRTLSRRAGLAAVLALSLLGVVACSKDSDTGSSDEKITLNVGLFGDFGFQPLYEEFKKTHPNVEIKERIADFGAHHQNLAAHLATNSGAADIEAVELAYISQFTSQPGKFHNLLDQGAGSMESQWLPWKWQQGLSTDKKSLIGLGTDVGGMAMCYRTDLFAKAGLPTERDKVSALWPTWQEYVNVGKTYQSKAGKGAYFFEASGNMFRAMVEQGQTGVYDNSDKIIVGENPDVKKAWDLTVDAIKAGESAKLAAWTPEWTAAFGKGTFATIVCPAWMTAYIEGNAKDAAGKWDVATVPGGSGNMGGSHLVLPKQGKHPKEAYELIKFLTSSESQAAVFKKTGNFPSLPKLYDDPSITGFSKAYFNNAPIGKIFSDAAKAVQPQHMGPKTGDVMTAIGQGLGRIEQGQQQPDAAWTQVLSDVAKLQ